LKPYGRSSPYVGGITPEGLMAGVSADFIRLDHEQIMAHAPAISSSRLLLSCPFTSLSGVPGSIQRYG
jgi:hypothetical protein